MAKRARRGGAIMKIITKRIKKRVIKIPNKYCQTALDDGQCSCLFLEELSVGRGTGCILYRKQVKINLRYNHPKPKFCKAKRMIVEELHEKA